MYTATVYPKPGDEANVARTLLAMADDPAHVRTNTDNGLSFLVPEYLLDRYAKGGTGEEEAEQETPMSEEIARRRPGRPRKIQPPKEGD